MSKKQKCPSDAAVTILDYAIIRDAARLTGIAETTIRGWIATGAIPTIKWHGGKSLVRITDVRRLKMDRPTRGRPVKKIQ